MSQQKCDQCGRYFLFMKLYHINPYSDFQVCAQCLHPEADKRRKHLNELKS
jgi:ribosomal protein L37E